MLLLIIVLLLLFGGGGGYYGYSRWGSRGGAGDGRDGRAHCGGLVLPRRIAMTLQGRSRERCLQMFSMEPGNKGSLATPAATQPMTLIFSVKEAGQNFLSRGCSG